MRQVDALNRSWWRGQDLRAGSNEDHWRLQSNFCGGTLRNLSSYGRSDSPGDPNGESTTGGVAEFIATREAVEAALKVVDVDGSTSNKEEYRKGPNESPSNGRISTHKSSVPAPAYVRRSPPYNFVAPLVPSPSLEVHSSAASSRSKRSSSASLLRSSVAEALMSAGLEVADAEPGFRWHFPPSKAKREALGLKEAGATGGGDRFGFLMQDRRRLVRATKRREVRVCCEPQQDIVTLLFLLVPFLRVLFSASACA